MGLGAWGSNLEAQGLELGASGLGLGDPTTHTDIHTTRVPRGVVVVIADWAVVANEIWKRVAHDTFPEILR